MLTDSEIYFNLHVTPAVNDFLKNIRDIRLGHIAVVNLCHMADYWANDNKIKTQEMIRVIIYKCPEFSIIREIANASKHAYIKKPKLISSFKQVKMTSGLFNAPFGEGLFGEATSTIVALNDGTIISLESIVQIVYYMLEETLKLFKKDYLNQNYTGEM